MGESINDAPVILTLPATPSFPAVYESTRELTVMGALMSAVVATVTLLSSARVPVELLLAVARLLTATLPEADARKTPPSITTSRMLPLSSKVPPNTSAGSENVLLPVKICVPLTIR